MLFSITIATRGHIERGLRPALCIASDGLLYRPPVTEEIIFDSGGGVTGKVKEDLYRWRLREEEEILNIVMTIVLSGRL
jgi:hypothetical protein